MKISKKELGVIASYFAKSFEERRIVNLEDLKQYRSRSFGAGIRGDGDLIFVEIVEGTKEGSFYTACYHKPSEGPVIYIQICPEQIFSKLTVICNERIGDYEDVEDSDGSDRFGNVRRRKTIKSADIASVVKELKSLG